MPEDFTEGYNYKKILNIKYNKAASAADTGMVKTQAQSKLTVMPQRTAETLLANPTPMIEPVMVCVVETGILKYSVINNVMAPEVSAATPSRGVTFVIFVPIVFTIFHPPLMVPAAIEV